MVYALKNIDILTLFGMVIDGAFRVFTFCVTALPKSPFKCSKSVWNMCAIFSEHQVSLSSEVITISLSQFWHGVMVLTNIYWPVLRKDCQMKNY